MMKSSGRMMELIIPYIYFSEGTLCHLKLHQGLSERYQWRAQDVTLACKLIHVYGKYHLAMLHRQFVYTNTSTLSSRKTEN